MKTFISPAARPHRCVGDSWHPASALMTGAVMAAKP